MMLPTPCVIIDSIKVPCLEQTRTGVLSNSIAVQSMNFARIKEQVFGTFGGNVATDKWVIETRSTVGVYHTIK